MKIVNTPGEMQQEALRLRGSGRVMGLVPTMGYLHEGHLSLIRLAKERVDTVMVSIFVNPTQFAPNEDLSRYPRDFVRDEGLCESQGADVIFYPTAADMYRSGHSVYVVEDTLSAGLCGLSRPTHFRGVATVVAKLFNLTLPHVAVFGEKDAQQLRIIERMTRDLNFPITIVRGPIVREPDGLAMSSRNVYLSPEERQQALCLRRALDRAEEVFRGGERKAAELLRIMQAEVAQAPAARIDYIELVDDETLKPVVEVSRPCLIAMAVFVGKTRLIDNTVLRL